MRYRVPALVISALLSSVNSYAADLSINDIRHEYKIIREAMPALTKMELEMDGYSAEGGRAVGYIDSNNQIRLIRAELYGESGDHYEEYYYLDGELFFAFHEEHRFNAPFYVTSEMANERGGEAFDKEKTKIYENRYYFSGGTMVRWLDPDKKSKDKASAEFVENEKSVKDFSDVVYGLVSEAITPNSAALQAEEFYIEDESLVAVTDVVDNVIRSSGDQELVAECQFIGKAVDLDGDSKAGDMIVTTKDGCAWGGAAGPIWVLRELDSTYSVALHFVSYSFELSEHTTSGLRDITISSGTAGYAEISLWEYDGEQYNETGTFYFDANDLDACKARPDICPFEI